MSQAMKQKCIQTPADETVTATMQSFGEPLSHEAHIQLDSALHCISKHHGMGLFNAYMENEQYISGVPVSLLSSSCSTRQAPAASKDLKT